MPSSREDIERKNRKPSCHCVQLVLVSSSEISWLRGTCILRLFTHEGYFWAWWENNTISLSRIQVWCSRHNLEKTQTLDALFSLPSFLSFLSFLFRRMNGAEKLILDFQNNFGGDIVDGYSFLAILFPDHPLRQFPTQFRASKLIQQLVDAAAKLGGSEGRTINSNFYWETWAEPNGVPYNDSSGFFYPLVSKQFGGVSEEYSKPFSVNPDLVSVESLFESAAEAGADGVGGGFGLHKEPLFSQENILFVTNGLCVSVCATVASYVEEMTNVTTVAVGGMMDLPMAIENTGGGQVESFGELQRAISAFGLSESPYAPAPFDWLKTNFRFTIRQDLSLEAPHTPLEFLFKPAHRRVMYTDANVLNQHQLYLDVSALFG